MLLRKAIIRIVMLLIVGFVAFFGGFTYHDVTNGVSRPQSLFTTITMLPHHIKLGVGAIVHGDQDNASKPFESYAYTLSTVQAAYYGKAGSTRELTYSAIRGMMASLGDRYTRFLAPTEYSKMQEENQGEFVGIGAQLDENDKGQVFVVKPLPNSPALRAHLLTGDIIAKVNDKAVLGTDITKVVQMIRGEPRTKVDLTIIRKGLPKPLVVSIIRNYVHQEVVVSRMVDPQHKVGYIALAQFNEESDKQVNVAMNELRDQGMRGLIFDLRGNPGGLLNIAQDVASRFVTSGPIVWVKERGAQMESFNVEQSKHNHPRYPLVVLVNSGSASASEITSGAVKDTHAGILIGERTFGKGLVQTIIPLPDRSAVAITTAHYYTPAKNDINHKGIDPDISVKLTDDDQRKMNDYSNNNPADPIDLKYDRQLQKAVAVMDDKLADGAHPQPW
ncbi:MAG: S41 family peptidase [Capsulimonadaceae bacterium]|nr:S41 family peptidase [Capsulimonadaceae bacterium]